MKAFRDELDAAHEAAGTEPHGGEARKRRWVYAPYDQLTHGVGPLSEEDPDELGLVLIESAAKAARRPYHVQKLAFILANQRHFALEQALRGVGVRYVASDRSYRPVLEELTEELGPVELMEPAELELRRELAPLVDEGRVEVRPHEAWLTTPEHFGEARDGEGRWRMDAFYRRVRKELDVLMEDGKPVGGKYSFDAENRDAWPGEPPAPEPPTFEPDAITSEVGALIERKFPDHPGRLDLSALPTTADDARRLWRWARDEAMPHFGPFEDAMSRRSRGLFHTRISPLLNVCRLLPRPILDDALALDVPISTREGFVRQVLGWREFMRHMHRETKGFRDLPGVETGTRPGDAGYEAWHGAPHASDPPDPPEGVDGGADPAGLEDDPAGLPPAFWGEPSGLACLDLVVESVWDEAWSHHITRLMVLGNIASLLGVSPRDLTDWFWAAYMDAFDWVVEPNVVGMATFAVGDVMTTKPYVSGANYIRRMSDYCESCAFDPRSDCPLTRLYWAYLARHREALDDIHRMNLPLANLKRRSESDRAADQRTFEWARATLGRGEPLTPEDARRAVDED